MVNKTFILRLTTPSLLFLFFKSYSISIIYNSQSTVIILKYLSKDFSSAVKYLRLGFIAKATIVWKVKFQEFCVFGWGKVIPVYSVNNLLAVRQFFW